MTLGMGFFLCGQISGRALASFLLPLGICYALEWPVGWKVSFFGWLFGLLAWAGFGLWLCLRRRRWAYFVSLLIGAFLAAAGWAAQALAFHWLGQPFTRGLFWIGDVFTVADAKGYLLAFGLPALPLAFLVFVCTVALWWPWNASGVEFRRRYSGKVICLCVSILALCVLSHMSFRSHVEDFAGMELETTRTVSEMTLLVLGAAINHASGRNYYFSFEEKPVRMSPAVPLREPPDFDVLMVIHESFSHWAWPGLMPRTRSEAKKRNGVVFTQAYTPSTFSVVALKSLFTGVTPSVPNSRRLLNRHPILWQWAEAAGMETVLGYNNWLERSLSLRHFFLSPAPTHVVTRETMPRKVARGLNLYEGELHLVRDLVGVIREIPVRKRLLTVWYSQAMHLPCEGNSPLLTVSLPEGTACERAAGLVDHALGLIMDALEEAGRLGRTLVVITADHGEYPDGVKRPGNFSKHDWQDGIIRVPLIVWLPRAWYENRPEMAGVLAANAGKRVSTLDATRMVIDLMGGGRVEGGRRLSFPETVNLAVEIVSDDRWIEGMNRRSFLSNVPVGFVLVGDGLQVVYNEKKGLWVQDFRSGGTGVRESWEEVRAPLKTILCPVLLGRPEFARMVREGPFGVRYGSGLGCLRELSKGECGKVVCP